MKNRKFRKCLARVTAVAMATAVTVTAIPAAGLTVRAEVSQESTDAQGTAQEQVRNIAPDATAEGSLDMKEDGGGLAALNDENEPVSSTNGWDLENNKAWHSWTKEGEQVYVQYNWDAPVTVSGSAIYYFADGGPEGMGGVRVPQETKYEYYDEGSGSWVTIKATVQDEHKLDQYNELTFDTPVVTNKLRLTMTPQGFGTEEKHAVGIREWKVMGTPAASAGDGDSDTGQMYPEGYGNVAKTAAPSACFNNPADLGGVAMLNGGSEPASSGDTSAGVWHNWGSQKETEPAWIQYDWEEAQLISGIDLYFFKAGNFQPKANYTIEYLDDSGAWQQVENAQGLANELDVYNRTTFTEISTTALKVTLEPDQMGCGVIEWRVIGKPDESRAPQPDADGVIVKPIADGYRLSNDYFVVETGKYGNINSLKIKGDEYDTNYVMNPSNAAAQAGAAGHQWLGELMFQVKANGATDWSEQNTGRSDSGRTVSLEGSKVVVTYENATEEKGIKDFKVIETYALTPEGKLHWEIEVVNTTAQDLVIGDFGVPLAFNEYWPGGEEIYETRTVDHSFVGKNNSYIYITRPSGLGRYLLMTPDKSTGAGFEYQDHWRDAERAEDERAWCQDQAGWANGLNVFYIHSDVIKSTNRGYLENTSLTLGAGESKTYAFNFQMVENEDAMKQALYKEGILDAVAVPGMTYSVNMPGKMYLHTSVPKDAISFEVQCPHTNGLHAGNPKTVSNNLDCQMDGHSAQDCITYEKTVEKDGELYHVYNLQFYDLGQNHVIVNYTQDGQPKQTVLQFYMMADVAQALETHSDFMVEKTQINTPGETGDKVFDDWMMDTKQVRMETDPTYWEKNYWGWGDDWGLTHGEYIAEKNVYQPVAKEIEAVDQYLDVAIWNGLMREHQKDYKIHDFLMVAPNTSPDGRGYAFPHIYNTYFSMYKIAKKFPDTVEYIEDKDTYLLRAYHILNALYGEGVGYNWGTGLMGELTTPDIIAALEEEGYYDEADNVLAIMAQKYDSFKAQTYPYGSEYSYDNTGEEAVYTLAKVNLANDTDNADRMMSRIDAKTRACRGVQPVWYHYANPTTICGENWWNFQYTASLAGYCMDDWLRLQENAYDTPEKKAEASRVNYAAKLANLTCINSGQIDADPENIGAISWTYQSEMGNLGGQGTGEGNLHNGWRQMAGEADLGLFGALQILSSDVVTQDPVFGLFGYGCKVADNGSTYTVNPLDGLYTRLNFMNEKLYIELNRDQYTKADVAKDASMVELTMKNLEQTAHEAEIAFTGLASGSYEVFVNGTKVEKESFQAAAGQTSTVSVPLPEGETAVVRVAQGGNAENQAPVVEAGDDRNVKLSDAVRLKGKVSDDGFAGTALTYEWSVEAPAGQTAELTAADRCISNVTFSGTGTYIFTLKVSDGRLEASDTVTYTVGQAQEKPEILAGYDFEGIQELDKYVQTASGEEYYGILTYNPQITAEGKEGSSALKMNGAVSGGYVELPHALTKGVDDATISADVYLGADQKNHTPLFVFGDGMKLEFANGNEVVLIVNGKTLHTGVTLAAGFWKNIAVTALGDAYTVYVDGVLAGTLTDTGLKLSDISDAQRYFIGRTSSETAAFFNGIVDNFVMKSKASTDSQMKEEFGSDAIAAIISAKEPSVVTMAGTAPELPKQVQALYSDGIYRGQDVVWEAVEPQQYEKAGTFVLAGTIKGTEIAVTAKVMVVAGTLQNIASKATPTAIIDSVEDLGGVAGLNDGIDPANSADTSNGAWHNWLGGNQGGPAWVQYTWEEPQLLAKTDIYFFQNGAGNFNPASYTVEYMDESGSWKDVPDAQGLGVELNQYNTTTFTPVYTTALRVMMKPAALGCGILEWKAYGYKDGAELVFTELNAAIRLAEGLNPELFTAGMDEVTKALAAAKEVAADKEHAAQGTIDAAAQNLNLAILKLTPAVEHNVAYMAGVETSFISSWEKLSAVNDGIVYDNNNFDGKPHYGTWGNESDCETVTYKWAIPVQIAASDVYFWTDGGGIVVPASYVYEYLDSDGSWKAVTGADGYKVLQKREGEEEESLNGFNRTTFDEISTTALRITINKPERTGDGIGMIEWRVFGKMDTSAQERILALQKLQAAIDRPLEKQPEEYTADSYQAYAQALVAAKLLAQDAKADAKQLAAAQKALTDAYDALKVKPQENTGSTDNDKDDTDKDHTDKGDTGSSDTTNSSSPDTATPEKQQAFTDKKTNADYIISSETSKNVVYAGTNNKGASVRIPSTVTHDGVTYKVVRIDNEAFKNNRKITRVTIGGNIRYIGKEAFYGCTKLKTVKLGSNTAVIHTKAFYGCTNLTSVTIPAKTTTVGAQVFTNCKRLKVIVVKSQKLTSKNVSGRAFVGISKNTVIKVPANKVKTYTRLFRKKGLHKNVKVVAI